MEFLLCNKRKIAVKVTVYTKIQLSHKHFFENLKITDYNVDFES